MVSQIETPAQQRDKWIAESHRIGQEKAELVETLSGMIGLVDLLCARSDVSPEFKKVAQENHRVVAARALLAKLK